MRNRIFWSILLTSVLLLTTAGLILIFTMYHSFTDENIEEVKTEAQYLLTGYEQGGTDYLDAAAQKGTNRISLISANGDVIYDSRADITIMQNHTDRTEIADAIENGYGSDIRDSATSGEKSYYYALKASDGNILRVTASMDSMTNVLNKSVTLFLVLLAFGILVVIFVSSKITKAIIRPINTIDPRRPLESDIYDELNPLLVRMDQQNKKIKDQLAALEKAKSDFEDITNQMSEALIIFSYDKKVLSANNSSKHLFDISHPEGKYYFELSGDEIYKKSLSDAFKGKATVTKLSFNDRIYRFNINPIKSPKGNAALLFAQDITINETAEQMRREFSANVSHELKTPLTSIMGAAEIMQAGIAPVEDYGHFISQIYKESKRLLDLIEDIIDLSRLDEGTAFAEFTSCDLSQISSKVINELSRKARDNSITLRASGEKVYVQGIESSLHEMIYNLCDNAIKYNEPGGYVEIGTVNSIEPVLYVKDNGIGIAKENHERIFERFYRVDKSRSKQSGGTGLGLSIVKHTALLHNADISLDSDIGKGTLITITFKSKEI